jgi:Zn-dependent peptidase ImmA (M78 family)/transcriptional regulator with XRE-family HTH domain
MSIDATTLANRLKEARTRANLTQEFVAGSLGIPRTAVVQMEAGNRAVSTLELVQLAALYGRPIAGFFEDSPTPQEDVFVSLLRAAGPFGEHPEWQAEISHYLAICRAGVELERALDFSPHVGPPTYQMDPPRRVMEAVKQGAFIAEQERLRLALGHNPIPDMSDLINGQNIWASGAKLPAEMSGLFLHHDSIGLCILVHFKHGRARKRFSYAHEYAHALLDRHKTATVSLEQNRKEFDEVRANAFAAAFLLPRAGVWAFLEERSKAGPSLVEQTVYDPGAEGDGDEVRGQRRTAPGSQDLTFEDVAALAHHFGASYQAALYRLKSLLIVNEAEFTDLKNKELFGKTYLELLQVSHDLDGQDERTPDREIVSQVLHLALEAYRREEISRGKLRDVSNLLNIPAEKLVALADAI